MTPLSSTSLIRSDVTGPLLLDLLLSHLNSYVTVEAACFTLDAPTNPRRLVTFCRMALFGLCMRIKGMNYSQFSHLAAIEGDVLMRYEWQLTYFSTQPPYPAIQLVFSCG